MASDDIDSLEEELDALEDDGGRRQQIMRFLPIILAVGALVIFAVIVLIAYSGGDEAVPVAQPPTLAPPQQTVKIEPENEGGMEIPDQDKQVYNQIGEGAADQKVENILPQPETPKEPPKEPAKPTVADAGASPPPPPPPDTGLALPDVPQTPAPPPAPGTPKPGEAVSKEAGGAVAKPDGKTAATVPTVIPDQPQTPAPAPNETQTAAAQQAKPGILQPPAAPVQKKSAEPPATSQMRTMAGVYRVQVASLKSQNQAEVAWKEQVARHPELLSKLSLTVQRAVLADKGTYYRVQAGPFDSRDAADSLCRKLKSRGQDCIVVRP